jgi:hypothetical protein
LIEGFV